MMDQFAVSLIGGALLASSLGLLYMAVAEKLDRPNSSIFLGMAALVAGTVLLAIVPYLPGV